MSALLMMLQGLKQRLHPIWGASAEEYFTAERAQDNLHQ